MEGEFMTIKELGVVCQSKKDMFKVFQVDGEIYLPPIEQSDHKFVAQIVTGEKNVIQN